MDNDHQEQEPARKWDGNPITPITDAEFDELVSKLEREQFGHEH